MDIMKPENETEEKIFKSHVPGLFQRYLVGVFMVPLVDVLGGTKFMNSLTARNICQSNKGFAGCSGSLHVFF